MKKFVVGVAVALATLIMCMCFAGCSVAGTYKLESVTIKVGGVETTVKVGEEFEGETLSADSVVLDLNSDNTWKLTSAMMGETLEGKWEEKDGKYVLSVEGEEETLALTKDGSKLVMEQELGAGTSMKMVLAK